jgi:hypothetical protein
MKWHKGPPPSIGWWPASIERDPEVFRWWNGEWWSIDAYQSNSEKYAEQLANRKALWQHSIEWTTRPKWWPERSKT